MTDHSNDKEEKVSPTLSLVILCYRSESYAKQFVAHTIEVLEENGIEDYQLVLVGNYVEGSTDTTPQVVYELAAGNSKIICSAKPKEGWMGWDMRSGLELATGTYLAVIDGDGQMPVADVNKIYNKIIQDRLDLVKTFRIIRGDTLVRKFLSVLYNLSFKILFPGLYVRDINSKPKIMTRRAYEMLDLKSDDWFIDAEIMIQARRNNFKIGEIPTGFLGLTGRRSFISMKTIFEFLRNLLVYRILEFKEKR